MTGTRRSKRRVKRTLIDVHSEEPLQEDEELENEFERERAERIRRNEAIMEKLGVQNAAKRLGNRMDADLKIRSPAKRKAPTKASKQDVDSPVMMATRRSARIKGVPAKIQALLELEDPSDKEETVPKKKNKGEDHGSAMFQEDYFKFIGEEVEPVLVSDAHFKGWVNPEICERYDIEQNADLAWEKNGGGKWTRKIDKNEIPSNLKAKGWSDARAYASTMLKKNPNSYFYRHVAPHQKQAHGEWTQEEHDAFLDTAKKFGVGDKWGLFASYIPNRVGYQCSAYYRDVIIAQGLIFDQRFKITQSGKAHFVKKST
ncbi:hypothetical protein BSKO_07573 [Bryopsis sp. KO-2023]|nr:hypothetical protein BSKO_07573 [Bryopsis sp. KO-2023]